MCRKDVQRGFLIKKKKGTPEAGKNRTKHKLGGTLVIPMTHTDKRKGSRKGIQVACNGRRTSGQQILGGRGCDLKEKKFSAFFRNKKMRKHSFGSKTQANKKEGSGTRRITQRSQKRGNIQNGGPVYPDGENVESECRSRAGKESGGQSLRTGTFRRKRATDNLSQERRSRCFSKSKRGGIQGDLTRDREVGRLRTGVSAQVIL